jgi:ribosomal protein L34E
VSYVDPVRWFEEFPTCAVCRKHSHGILRGPQNQSYGYYCTRCAASRLKKAKQEQERAEKTKVPHD